MATPGLLRDAQAKGLSSHMLQGASKEATWSLGAKHCAVRILLHTECRHAHRYAHSTTALRPALVAFGSTWRVDTMQHAGRPRVRRRRAMRLIASPAIFKQRCKKLPTRQCRPPGSVHHVETRGVSEATLRVVVSHWRRSSHFLLQLSSPFTMPNRSWHGGLSPLIVPSPNLGCGFAG